MGWDAPFKARVETRNGIARVAMSGDLDLATVPSFEDHLAQAEQDSIRAIMVDLREVTFIDSSGLHAFIKARQRAGLNGHLLLIVGASAFTRRLFELTGTEFLLDDANGVMSLVGGGQT
jgi:anti-anti-sigma factor